MNNLILHESFIKFMRQIICALVKGFLILSLNRNTNEDLTEC